MSQKRYAAECLSFVIVVVLGGLLLAKCKSPDQAVKNAAEAGYGAEMQACVAKADARADADACREAVRVKWGVGDGGAK